MSLDSDGYPDEESLKQIASMDVIGRAHEWFALIEDNWWMPDWGFDREKCSDDGKPIVRYSLSTGGWSGNEDVIEAMQQSMGWVFWWQSSRRGGHYIFQVPDEEPKYE